MYFSPAQVQVEEHFLCQMRGALSFGSAALDTETAQIHSIGGLTTTRRTQLRSLGLQRIRSRMTLRQRGQFFLLNTGKKQPCGGFSY